jgi:hypothetical protein
MVFEEKQLLDEEIKNKPQHYQSELQNLTSIINNFLLESKCATEKQQREFLF